MQIFLVTMPVAILRIPTSVLWVAVKLLDCFASVIIGFSAFVATAYYSYRMGFGLPGMAVSFVIGQISYLLAAWIFTLRLISHEQGNLPRLDDEQG